MSIQPGEFTRFIGRRHELSEVRHLLAASRLVTLTGIGGAGKTRIARRITSDLKRSYSDGTWFVELADLTDPALLGHTVAGVLGLTVQSGEFEQALLTDFLSGRQCLLVLDNCEHLSVDVARLVVSLLESCPHLKVLATSRMPLGIAGEAIFQVPPLSVPDADNLPPIEAFGQYESITLFLERATTALPSFQLTPENAEPVAKLVNALEGVPLALELAAARIRVLSPEDMLERISDRYHLLSRGFRDAPARQQSLMASMSWSYDLCTPQEQTLWCRLSVFTGGFELDSAEAVCAGDGLDALDILDLVASLLDKSVLVRDDSGSTRYRMLETIRQYGVDRLEANGQHDVWRDRHRDWYAELVDRSYGGWVGPDQIEWVDRLHQEHPNLRAALDYSLRDAETAPIALRMVHGLEQFWICSGYFSEARRWSELALGHGTGTVEERALALRICVWFAILQADLGYAADMLDKAYAVGGASTDGIVQGYLQFSSGALATWQADVERGLPFLHQAIDTFHQVGHINGEIHLLFFTGMCTGWAQRYEEAAELHRRCIALADRHQELFMRSYSNWALGFDALMSQDLRRATAVERESLRVKWAVKDNLGIALVFEMLSWIAAAEDRGERAAMLLGAADTLWQVIGMSLTRIPYLAEARATCETAVRGTLSEKAYDQAFRKGQSLQIPEAISFALEDVVEVRTGASTEESPLTAREDEVAALIGEGLSNRDIAGRLVISQRTAQGHVENILRKLGFTSRTQVAAWVAERKAVSEAAERHLRVVNDS